MAFLYDTVAEYDTEIAFVREQMHNAVKAKEFRLNTSQSDQKIVMDMKEIRAYLSQLTTERRACAQRSVGAGVTGIVVRRSL